MTTHPPIPRSLTMIKNKLAEVHRAFGGMMTSASSDSPAFIAYEKLQETLAEMGEYINAHPTPDSDAVQKAIKAMEMAQNRHMSRLEWDMYEKAICGLQGLLRSSPDREGLIEQLEAAKDPLENGSPDALCTTAARNYNYGLNIAIAIIKGGKP